MLFLLVLFLVMFIAIFLYTSGKGRRMSNVLLGSFFLALGLNLADSFLLLKQVYFSYPSLGLWGSNLLLLCGPLIFFYAQSVIYKDFHITTRKTIHFLPFAILFLFTEILYLAAGYQKQTEILNRILQRKLPGSMYIVSLGIYVHFVTYLLLALQLIKQYGQAAANKYADPKRVTLTWLKTTIWFFLLLLLVTLVGSYLSYQSFTKAYFIMLSCTVFLLLGFIVLMLFKALGNPAIFSVMEESEVKEAAQPAKYTSSTMADGDKKSLLERLLQHMQTQKPYFEPELTLDALAAQLQVKPKILSQVINELQQQNFFEFINHYRIEEAKKLLNNPKDKKITVLEVMYEVGFNSKSSFNTLFKKSTGLTPSEYKKQSME